ncbi:hypothetical protein EsDP_00003060 [Epichloe bromicola]|uniref:Peptidase A1 domain-containing protein n=1 Tax=Epichloe bromicola TaxID=79588 RepID=A0ABQ0CML8_9HYPO
MKVTCSLIRLSGPLLVLSGQVAAQDKIQLEVSQVMKVTDAVQGGFRPFMEFTVAGQVMKGLLDTGSGDWTMPRTGSAFCKSDGQQCDGTTTGFKAGSFDPASAGAQVRDVDQPLNASFTGGAQFVGKFIEAPLQITPGGKAVQVQMGLVEEGGVVAGETSFPVLGVGPVQSESVENNYPNVPARFKETNDSKVNAYGLYIGDFRSPENGTLVWGGFDAAKVDGKLKAAPLVRNQDGDLPRFVVDFSSVRLCPSKGSPERDSTRKNPSRGGNEPSRNNKQTGTLSESGDETESAGKFRRSVFARKVLNRRQRSSYDHTRRPLSTKTLLRRQRDGNILGDDLPPVVELDSGVPDLILSEKTVNTISDMLGAQPGPKGEFLTDCNRIKGMDVVIGMNKDAVEIRVPLDSLIAPKEPPRGPGAPGKSEPPQKARALGGSPRNYGGNQDGNGRGGNGQNENGRGRGGNEGGNDRGGKNRGGNKQGGNNRGGNNRGGNNRGGNNKGDDNRGGNNKGGNNRDGNDQVRNGNQRKVGDPGVCSLRIIPGEAEGRGTAILGAPAMQHMYVVFDMDSEVLMMAQAKANETKVDIREYIPARRK